MASILYFRLLNRAPQNLFNFSTENQANGYLYSAALNIALPVLKSALFWCCDIQQNNT
jgi:hypothetical protein